MNGVLVIDKPEGITSHDVVARVRRILRLKRVGHTGTLDPFATGVIIVLVGQATRLAQFLDKAEKEYLATVQFGFETDTGDRTGRRKAEGGRLKEEVTIDEIETILPEFRGTIRQTPPMYSAKKIAGKKLYELARKGVEVERRPVEIKISELEIAEDSGDDSKIQNPKSKILLRIVCSAGTYIRVLAEDIGRQAGAGAHLAQLRRTRAGRFDLSRSLTLEELEETVSANKLGDVFVSMNEALAHLPELRLTDEEAGKVRNGMKIAGEFAAADEWIRLLAASGELVAVGAFSAAEKTVQPRVVLV